MKVAQEAHRNAFIIVDDCQKCGEGILAAEGHYYWDNKRYCSACHEIELMFKRPPAPIDPKYKDLPRPRIDFDPKDFGIEPKEK